MKMPGLGRSARRAPPSAISAYSRGTRGPADPITGCFCPVDLSRNTVTTYFEIGSRELAHLVYAGADLVGVSGMFESCGLTQMIALKYGAVPIVRAVGRLPADPDAGVRHGVGRRALVFVPGGFRHLMLGGLRRHPGPSRGSTT